MRKLLLILVVFTTSCELVIDAEVPYIGDKIVVNAVQHPDSIWYVDLTSTKYILEEDWHYTPIASATVTVRKPDGSLEVLVSEPGNYIYRGQTKPEVGKEYTITVTHPNYESVEGQMKMPYPVKIINVEWDSSRLGPPPGNCGNCASSEVPFKITFADPPGENNFYHVNVYMKLITTYTRYPDGELVTDTIQTYSHTYLRDPGISDDEQSEFSDRTFDGKTVTLPFVSQMYVWGGSTHYQTEVWLTTWSEDLYKYNKTIQLQSEVDGDPFAQPVQIHSNMSNGFGIFAGMSADVKVYDAPKK